MVPSPVETWDLMVICDHYQRHLLLLQEQFAAWSWSPCTLPTSTSSPACDQLITSPRIIQRRIFLFCPYPGGGGTKRAPNYLFCLFLCDKKLRTIDAWLFIWRTKMYRRPPGGYIQQTFRKKKKKSKATGSFQCYSRQTILHFQCDHIVSCFFNMNIFDTFLVASTWLFVLRSEHDILQKYSWCKVLYLEGLVVWAPRTKTKKVNYCYIIYC